MTHARALPETRIYRLTPTWPPWSGRLRRGRNPGNCSCPCTRRVREPRSRCRGRGDRAPAAGALLDIRIVALRVLTIIPGRSCRRRGRLGRRLDIDRRRGLDDHRRIRIDIGIGIGSPDRSKGHDHGFCRKVRFLGAVPLSRESPF